MTSSQLCLSLVVLVGVAASADQWESKKDENGRKVQSLKIQAPSFTEEDQRSYTMPEQYRCDSCKAVAYHLTEGLKRKQPKSRRLQSWEYTELFDETCKSGFKGYGVSLVDGKNVLSGPGLKREKVEAGMGAIQMGGETWELRLGEICRKFVYDKIGEEEVYEHFRSQGEVSSDLCFSETRDCRVGPKAASKKSQKADAADKKAKKDKDFDAKGKGAEKIDISSFVSKLAKKQGLAPIEYTKQRSFAEWEQLFLQAATKLSDPIKTQPGQEVDV